MQKEKINSKQKWLIGGCALLVLLIAVFTFLYFNNKPDTVQGAKTITVDIIKPDSSRTVNINTDAEYLRAALEEKGLIQGEEAQYGLFVKTVDGLTVDDSKQEWWCFTKSGQDVNTGVDATPVEDGDKFEITLKTGY